MWISAAVFLLLVLGIIAICDIRFTALFSRMVKGSGTSTLSEDLEVMSGNTPRGFFKRESYEIEQILKATGRESRFESVKTFAVIGFAVGCLAALLVGNAFLVPVLGLAFAYIPVFYVRSTAGTYKKQLHMELETALSIINTSYLRTDDILLSIKENIDFINPPVKAHFEEFITESELINANTVTGLNRLKIKIPHAIFHEWVNGRIFGMRRAEDQIYCYDIASGKLSTLPKNPDAIVKFYVNEDTGNFFRITSVPGSYSIECTIFDTSYQIIRETKYAGQDSLDYHINYPPRDVTKDETVLVLEDNYGNILLLDTTKNDTYVWLEGSYRNEVAIKLVNPVCLMISGYDTLPWQLYNITTGDYCIYSEEYFPYMDTILGECYIAEGTDTFTLYRYGGEIAVYSHLLGENMDTLPGEPDIATNALTRDHSTDQWHTGDKFETVAISPDGKYQVVMEAGRRYDESVCHSAEFDYYTYWLTEAASGEQLFAIRFPKNRFMSVAVKDQERAAILDNGGIYYEFNPQNGEIYKCGRLVLETEAEMSLVQMVVDFEDGRVSVIGQNRLRAANPTKRKSMYSGGLFSTDTYELIYAYDTVLIGNYDYPAGFGYMKADAQCDHLYFKDTFAIEHLVLTLPNGKE